MKPETVLEIKNLIKDLVNVSQKSYDLYGCKDLSANEKRQFEYLSDRLFKEWKKIYDKYETEIIKSVQTYADAPDTTLGISCKPKKTNSSMQNPQLELPLWDPSKDVDRDGIINPKYKIT